MSGVKVRTRILAGKTFGGGVIEPYPITEVTFPAYGGTVVVMITPYDVKIIVDEMMDDGGGIGRLDIEKVTLLGSVLLAAPAEMSRLTHLDVDTNPAAAVAERSVIGVLVGAPTDDWPDSAAGDLLRHVAEGDPS